MQFIKLPVYGRGTKISWGHFQKQWWKSNPKLSIVIGDQQKLILVHNIIL